MNKITHEVVRVRKDFSLEKYTVTELVPVLITRASDHDIVDAWARNRKCLAAARKAWDHEAWLRWQARVAAPVTHELWLGPCHMGVNRG